MRGKSDLIVDGGYCEEPAWLANNRLVNECAAIVWMQCDGRLECSGRPIVIRPYHFVVAAFDPLKRMLIPMQAPAHVARFTDLMRTAVVFRNVFESELG